MAKNSKTATRAPSISAARKSASPRPPHARSVPDATRRRPAKVRTATKATAPTEFTFYVNPTLTLMCVPVERTAPLALEVAADLTGVHPEMLRYYCRLGLFGADRTAPGCEPMFDEAALTELRRIEHYRRHLTVSRRALPLICQLRRDAERQHIEIQFLHFA
jgi:hypothetical protein